MTVRLALGLLTLGACAAGASWAVQAWLRRLVRPRHALSVVTFCLLNAAAAGVDVLSRRMGHPAAMTLYALGAVVGFAAIAGAARLLAQPSALLKAAAEAMLVGLSLVSIFWVAAGSPAQADGRSVTALALTTIDVVAAALVLRIPRPGAAPAGRGCSLGPSTGGLLGSIVLIGLSDALMTVGHLGGAALVGTVSTAVRTAGFVLLAAVPYLPRSPIARPVGPGWAVRGLPYLLVAAGVGAQLVAAFSGSVSSVSVVLVALVVSALAVVQGIALRDNALLLRDLGTSRTKLEALVENVGDVILGIDGAGRVSSANAAAARLLHRTPEAMLALDVSDLAAGPDRRRLREVVDDIVAGRVDAERVELRLAAPATGSAELRLQAVDGGAVATLSDVTESVQLRERLERLARFDEMTGLANRGHFVDEVGGWLRAGAHVTVLYADLDGFKAVNDRFGHLCGDEVLAEAGRRLTLAVADVPGERHLLARIGGDEFVVALVGVTPEGAASAAEHLVATMRHSFPVADREVRIGLSVGVAATSDDVTPPLDPRDAADLLHRADVAMISAKQAGRSRVVRWDAGLEARALRRVDIAIGLRHALETGQLALAYQPLVRLSDGAVIGVEALIRVVGGDDAPGALAGLPELVTPAELVAVAEDTGEIVELGHWVLTEATRQAASWRRGGHDLMVSVNVSVRQMSATGFVDAVRAALAAAQLPARSLLVEITEGQLLSENDPAWETVGSLRDLGVVIVIDDFGSGYSSLAYLRHMPVRGVKLDRALLEGLTTDPRARALARAVIAAARALGLLVVAEGLESLEAARIARDLGAWAGQGFALYEALPASEVAGVLTGPAVALGVGRFLGVTAPPPAAHLPPALPEPASRAALQAGTRPTLPVRRSALRRADDFVVPRGRPDLHVVDLEPPPDPHDPHAGGDPHAGPPASLDLT